MKTLAVVLCFMLFLLASCLGMGKTANPVDTYTPMDNKMDCANLENEIYDMRDQTEQHYQKWQSERGGNIGAGIGSLIFWPMLFVLDLSDKEKIEYYAAEKRFNYLNQLYIGKECDFERPSLVLKRDKKECPYPESYYKWKQDKRCNPELKEEEKGGRENNHLMNNH